MILEPTEEIDTPETEALVVEQEVEQDSQNDNYLKNFVDEEDAVSERELEEPAEHIEAVKGELQSCLRLIIIKLPFCF